MQQPSLASIWSVSEVIEKDSKCLSPTFSNEYLKKNNNKTEAYLISTKNYKARVPSDIIM